MENVIQKAIQRVICVNVREDGKFQNVNTMITAITLPVPTMERAFRENTIIFACAKRTILENCAM